MMKDLIVVLLVPVGLGQLGRAVKPIADLATRHKIFLGVISQVLILSVIVKAAALLGERLQENSAWETGTMCLAALLTVTVHLLALAGGFWTAAAWDFDRGMRIAVAFSSSQKTLPVALVLFDAYFRDYPLAVIPLVFYHAGQLIVDTIIADRLADQGRRESIMSDQPVSV
jgi:solute carrier family 10 (sodium/bile acid cotransporter), member 7